MIEDKNAQDKVIELKNVAVHYTESKSLFTSKKYEALKDVSFDVIKGETLGIIGRNGAGKSTLLRLLAGIIKPDKGEVIHNCKSVSLMALAAGFDPNLSGRQNSIISGMLIGHSKKEMLTKLEEIKAFSELGDFYEKPVKTYSSGMKARLGFATAMNTHPDILLIDEVLAVGDSNFREKAEKAIVEKINSDITVIVVSHSESQLKKICNRLVWVEKGVVVHQSEDIDKILSLYRLNMKFSTSGVFIEDIKTLQKNIFFTLDCIEIKDGQVFLKCVFLNLDNERIERLKIMPLNSIFTGPTETPGLIKMYPKHIYASKGRYHDGLASFDEVNTLLMTIDGKEIPMVEFKIKKA